MIVLNAASLLDALHLIATAVVGPPPPPARSVLVEANMAAIRERIDWQREQFPTGLAGSGGVL